jgi:hypothetical protein
MEVYAKSKARMIGCNLVNFSIVLPGECNASCYYCLWKQSEKVHVDYIRRLAYVLDTLGNSITQVVLTGGEPTLSPFFDEVVEVLRGRWKTVTLVTNGTKLDEKIPKMSGVVRHINISRNARGNQDNITAFRTKDVPRKSELLELSDRANTEGMNTTISIVAPDRHFYVESLYNWVDFAKQVHASGLIVRKDIRDSSLCQLPVEVQLYSKRRQSKTLTCCENFYWVDGFPVFFKMGLEEGKGGREYIFQPSGDLTLDWSGNTLCSKDVL